MLKYGIYLAVGFSLSQFFHTLVFYQVGRVTVTAFPHFQLPLGYAFLFSLIIGILIFIILVIGKEVIFGKLSLFAVISLLFLLISQVFSRSLIKFGFESVFLFVVFSSLLLEKFYDIGILKISNKKILDFNYSELLGLFNLSLCLSLFWLVGAALGFRAAVRREYIEFEGQLMIQWQMLRYGILLVYSLFGIGWLILYPLLSKLNQIKETVLPTE